VKERERGKRKKERERAERRERDPCGENKIREERQRRKIGRVRGKLELQLLFLVLSWRLASHKIG